RRLDASAERRRGRPATRASGGAQPGRRVTVCERLIFRGPRTSSNTPRRTRAAGGGGRPASATRRHAVDRVTSSPMAPQSQSNSTYSDGHPCDAVRYREYKLILLPDRFTSPEALHEFGKLVRGAAKKAGVAVTRPAEVQKEHLREIVFFDTPSFDLYEGSFILRQRAAHQDGWPIGDSELT